MLSIGHIHDFLLVFHCKCLSCTISEILAIISQNFKRSRDPECTPYCRTLTYVTAVLFTFNQQTKFEMSSFIRSKDIAWAPKCRNESRNPDHAPLGGQVVMTRLTLHVANSCTKFEVSSCSRWRDISGGVKFWPWPRPFRDDLLSSGWDLLPLIHRANVRFLTTPITKIWKAVQNGEIGVVWGVMGHSRSSEMSPFDRAHMTSYSTLIQNWRLSCCVFEL